MEDEEGSSQTTVKIDVLGCKEGQPWDDGPHSTIRRLLIYYRQWICSLRVEYDKNGCSYWGQKHGGNEGFLTEVMLDYTNEYLISICGYFGNISKCRIAPDVIRSLTIQTNRKTYGPFGMEEGTKFSFPIMGAKIVGLHGRCGWYLDAIGLYIRPIPKSQLKNCTLGPFGGKGGHSWEYVFRSIRRFVVNYEQWIHSIQFQYEDKKGKLVWSKKHGDKDGKKKAEVVLEFPDEHFVSIQGYYSDIDAGGVPYTVIRSMTLKTNRITHGPFGFEDGTRFSFPIMGTNILGVNGRSGRYLDAIGLYLGTKMGLLPEPPKHLNLGRYGGKGGDPWEETFQTIRRLVIYHGLWIDSIQMEYVDENQKLSWSKKHGGDGGRRSEVVLELDEHLVLVYGYYSDVQKWGTNATVIRSLTLKTNKRIYGPFGIEDGTKFSFPSTGLKIVSIHGRSRSYLEAIGLSVHLTQSQIDGLGLEKFSLGKYGGEGGYPWEVGFRRIRQLVINHGQWIDSIQMEYEDQNGELVWSKNYGGNGGSQSKVVLDFPNEDLVTIYGYYDDPHHWGLNATVIRSLTLETNVRTYGPFGVENGTTFSFPTVGVKIVGIHGQSEKYLYAIGLHALSFRG